MCLIQIFADFLINFLSNYNFIKKYYILTIDFQVTLHFVE